MGVKAIVVWILWLFFLGLFLVLLNHLPVFLSQYSDAISGLSALFIVLGFLFCIRESMR